MTTCVTCAQPLVLHLEAESDEENDSSSSQTVPDDVRLRCGCHFHWQCLLDAYQVTECPGCKRDVSTTGPGGEQQVLCDLRNEGGIQEGLNILPLLTEESYLQAYPEERRARAFLEFCREGDVEAICDLLLGEDDGVSAGEEEVVADKGRVPTPVEILGYQDPLGSMYSGLHVAVIHEQVRVIWILLLLASGLDMRCFPAEVLQAAQHTDHVNVAELRNRVVDIRSLKDENGMTADQHAMGSSLSRVFDVTLLEPRHH